MSTIQLNSFQNPSMDDQTRWNQTVVYQEEIDHLVEIQEEETTAMSLVELTDQNIVRNSTFLSEPKPFPNISEGIHKVGDAVSSFVSSFFPDDQASQQQIKACSSGLTNFVDNAATLALRGATSAANYLYAEANKKQKISKAKWKKVDSTGWTALEAELEEKKCMVIYANYLRMEVVGRNLMKDLKNYAHKTKL